MSGPRCHCHALTVSQTEGLGAARVLGILCSLLSCLSGLSLFKTNDAAALRMSQNHLACQAKWGARGDQRESEWDERRSPFLYWWPKVCWLNSAWPVTPRKKEKDPAGCVPTCVCYQAVNPPPPLFSPHLAGVPPTPCSGCRRCGGLLGRLRALPKHFPSSEHEIRCHRFHSTFWFCLAGNEVHQKDSEQNWARMGPDRQEY